MKAIHKKLTFLGMAVLVWVLPACEDYLEKPKGSDVNIDVIFAEKIKAETFLWETYRTCVPNGFPNDWNDHDGMNAGMLMAASDEGDIFDTWPSPNMHNTGVWGPTGNGEDIFGWHYDGIRNANIFLENVDRVPDMAASERAQMKAEAIYLRALQYAELLKRYGGIPLVKNVLVATGEVKLPRNTFAECVDFIVASCDEAAAILPNAYPANFRGRITKGAALALKGRVLLYAASPLHNTTTPYLTEKRELTGYTSFDAARWQQAAEANKAVLDWAQANGVILVSTSADPATNYRNAIEQQNNSEVILAQQAHGAWGAYGPMFQQFAAPRGIYGGWYGHGVTLQHAQQYYTATGTDQTWADTGTWAEHQQKMQAMEPRFQYSVLYPGAKWNEEIGVRRFYKKKEGSWTDNAPVNGVGFMKKFLLKINWGSAQFNWIVFRLAEFHLNYAEALNEASPMAPGVYESLNVVRRRAGIPEILSTDSRYNTQEKLRQAIRRERAVELAFEEHRFFDVRRWMIAGQEGVMQGQMKGLNIYEQQDGSLIYKKEAFETRVWADKMYLYPFPQSEIDKQYMVQNPGW